MPIVAHSFYSGSLPPPPSAPDESAELHVIAEYVRRGRCVLFVGAGLSAAAGLPDWGRLMRALVERATPCATGRTLVPPHFDVTDDDQHIAEDPLIHRVRRAVGPARYDALVHSIERTRVLHAHAIDSPAPSCSPSLVTAACAWSERGAGAAGVRRVRSHHGVRRHRHGSFHHRTGPGSVR